SNIKTAPRERMPIQTYVTTYDENLLRDIIKRELARDGQIYFVYNYIDNIYNMASLIQKLIPNIKIGVIHGRLEKADIDDVMNSFYNHEIDLLCSTSIIENGIDVKNANLIIIYDADHFGLSQLYQIKGRVGRGDRLAYAYLMIRNNKEITDDAKKRLKSIQDFTELGSGYKISQRDLIIRGAGDILGPQQSGFIDEIGIDLYLKILKETIEEKKSGKPVIESLPVFSNLNIDAYIPSTYVNDENKLEIYQRIIEAKDENSLIKIKNEIKDIYGQIPDSVNLLFDKRKIDIKLEKHDIFNSLNEDQQFVIVNLSTQFSSIDGIGTNLFTSLISLVNVIKITYTNKRLSIKVYKRNNWVKTLNTILETCENLYNKASEKDVYED
ncbi:MAG: transcription-repair coupling factor, partial [Mollicutes bacterium]|nr:transcription-repair coupling factor [Mollicutes bacterium]